MASRQVERVGRKIVLWTLISIGVVIVAFLAYSTWGVYQKMQEAFLLKNNALEDQQDLQKRKDDLAATLARIHTPRGVEEEVRKRFSLGRPGEEEFVLVDPAPNTQEAAVTAAPGLWGWITKAFGF
jgi:hypothetical protein